MTRSRIPFVVLALAMLYSGIAAAETREPSTSRQTGALRDLPEAVRTALSDVFPSAIVVSTERERVVLLAYEVTFDDGGRRLEVLIAEDGSIVSLEEAVLLPDLPADVADTVRRVVGDANLRELERTEQYAVPAFLDLRAPRTFYEVEWKRDGRSLEVSISEDGSLVAPEIEDGADDVDDDSSKSEQD